MSKIYKIRYNGSKLIWLKEIRCFIDMGSGVRINKLPLCQVRFNSDMTPIDDLGRRIPWSAIDASDSEIQEIKTHIREYQDMLRLSLN